MKVLKIIGIIVVVFLALPFVVALFVKNEYYVKREIIINQPNEVVFNYIKCIRNQKYYSSWFTKDLEMHIQTLGEDGTRGYLYRWESDSKEVGVGEQEITQIIDGERIEFDLRFYKPFKSEDKGYLQTDSLTENTTKVTWDYKAKLKYPSNILLIRTDMEQIIGEEFQFGLQNLKRILEK